MSAWLAKTCVSAGGADGPGERGLRLLRSLERQPEQAVLLSLDWPLSAGKRWTRATKPRTARPELHHHHLGRTLHSTWWMGLRSSSASEVVGSLWIAAVVASRVVRRITGIAGGGLLQRGERSFGFAGGF